MEMGGLDERNDVLDAPSGVQDVGGDVDGEMPDDPFGAHNDMPNGHREENPRKAEAGPVDEPYPGGGITGFSGGLGLAGQNGYQSRMEEPVPGNDVDGDEEEGVLPKHSRALIGMGLCVYAVMRFPPMVSAIVVVFVLGTTLFPLIAPYIHSLTGGKFGQPGDVYKPEFWEDTQVRRSSRERGMGYDRDNDGEGLRRRDLGPPTQPVSKRFEFAFEDRSGDTGDERRNGMFDDRKGGKGRGRGPMMTGGKGGTRAGGPRPRADDPDERRRNVVRADVDKDLQRLCDDSPILRPMDLDFRCRRFFMEQRLRDMDKYNESIELLLKSTMEKSRDSVRNWPAYLYTLLRKFDSELYEELRQKDDERRQRERAERNAGGF